jgi:signal transduction histidine kinase
LTAAQGTMASATIEDTRASPRNDVAGSRVHPAGAAGPRWDDSAVQASRATLVGVAVVGMVSVAAAIWLPLSTSAPLNPADNSVTIVISAGIGFVWLLAAMVTLVRQPSNELWKLMLAYLVLNRFVWALQYLPNPSLQGLSLTFVPMSSALFVHVVVAYPSGHLRTRFDRRLVGSVYAFVIGIYLLHGAMWEPGTSCSSSWCPANILLIWPNNQLAGDLARAGQLAAPIVGLLILYAIWRHWHAAAPAARRVLLPVIAAVPIAYVIDSLGYLADAFQSEPVLLALNNPVSHAMVLAIDVIVPGGLLLGVLRLRLDRGRVAGLVVELGRGIPAGGLRDVLARALGDPTLQLAFAVPDAAGYIDGSGHAVEMATGDPHRATARIERDGEPLAVLVHDPTIDDEDPGLVEAVSMAARLAIENEQLTAQVRAQLEEVRASRARIVAAGDEERRKVERDLHDGAQQRLVALAMRLEQARLTATDSTRLIDDTTQELREAIAEVRSLARGLYPPVLNEAGLAAAVESLTERASIPVDVDIPDTRFPAAIEVTAYMVVAEALTNLDRYAGASAARVTAAADGDRLTVTIADDGRGGADPSHGSGLKGLADRVGAIGGTLEVVSSPGEGTTVQALLPLAGVTG